jgi:hypothetical protein
VTVQPTDAPRLFLPGADLLGLCREAFARGQVVRMPIEGVSMSPWLLPGDILCIEPATIADLRVGQVALYERFERVIIHQLAGRRRVGRDWLAVMRVTSNNALEAPLEGKRVLGRVVSRERDGEVRELDRLPLDHTSRMKATWALLLHGRVGESSWVRHICGGCGRVCTVVCVRFGWCVASRWTMSRMCWRGTSAGARSGARTWPTCCGR